MCKCIVKALREAERDVWIVTNIHPYHLVQLHPMWPDALKIAKRRDYSDFPHLSIESRMSESCFDITFHLSNTASSSALLANSISQDELKQELAMASRAVPNKFYKIKRVAKDNKNQHSRLMEAAKTLHSWQ